MTNEQRTVTETLTYEERAVFGECPVCHAPHGRPCDGNCHTVPLVGEGNMLGAHLGRLEAAPKKRRIEYLD
jgi:hypothetical protein